MPSESPHVRQRQSLDQKHIFQGHLRLRELEAATIFGTELTDKMIVLVVHFPSSGDWKYEPVPGYFRHSAPE
jgi:hypothetical protein